MTEILQNSLLNRDLHWLSFLEQLSSQAPSAYQQELRKAPDLSKVRQIIWEIAASDDVGVQQLGKAYVDFLISQYEPSRVVEEVASLNDNPTWRLEGPKTGSRRIIAGIGNR